MHYHSLPCLHSGSNPWPYHLYQSLPPRRNITHSDLTMCYVGLELVVYGAVELGDVVLFFVGEQGLFGCEVLTRPVGQTDGVCDTGILATGLR